MQIVVKRLFPFFLLIVIFFPIIFLTKGTVVLAVNSSRTPFFDVFFSKASALGNAITVIFAVLLVLKFKLKWLAIFLLAFAFQIVLVLLFKKGIYSGELRPYLYFKNAGLGDLLHLVEGVKIRYVNTFPSGHTATIFYLTSFFALLSRNRTASWVLVVLGFIVGLSRIYLVQHFFVDVYFGMLFGLLSSVFAYLIVRAHPKKWHSQQIHFDLHRVHRKTKDAINQLLNG
ncbi:phosphatase PAP2 family protein [Flagellimonas beolgyonensis]|uniref:phosphatase PAP2 family protein n=1 Tax=Flagellimonas beolgyonensis TaxID=864064 RepID=UPI003D64604F